MIQLARRIRHIIEVVTLALAAGLGYYQWTHPNQVVQRYPWYPLVGPVVVLVGSSFFEVAAWVMERAYSKQNGEQNGQQNGQRSG